jgi:hypothetical protein
MREALSQFAWIAIQARRAVFVTLCRPIVGLNPALERVTNARA